MKPTRLIFGNTATRFQMDPDEAAVPLARRHAYQLRLVRRRNAPWWRRRFISIRKPQL